MRHGRWGNIGHVWANVEGTDIDTTAIQFGHGLTSHMVSGGSPSNLLEPETNDMKVEYTENINLNLKMDIKGDKAGINESKLEEAFEKTLNNSKLLKKISKKPGLC